MAKKILLRDEFTPTQKRMLLMLSDGMSHSREELHSCLDDNLGAAETNVAPHINSLRRTLEAKGEVIVCELVPVGGKRRVYYRRARLLGSPYLG